MKKKLTFLLCVSLLSTHIGVFANTDTEQSDMPVFISETSVETTEHSDEEHILSETTDEPSVSQEPASEEQDPAEPELIETTTSDVPEQTADNDSVENLTVSDPEFLRNSVTVNVYVTPLKHPKSSNVTLSLYSSDDVLLGTQTMPLTAQSTSFDLTFSVPEYVIGETFKLKLDSGITSMQYYSYTYYEGQSFSFPTYTYLDNDGNRKFSDNISISILPLYDKEVKFTYKGQQVDLYPGIKLIGENTMVPIRKLAEFIGFDVRFDQKYNTEVVSLGNEYIFFNVDTAYTTVFGKDLYATSPTVNIDGTIYVSLRTFADAVKSSLEVKDNGTSLDINMTNASFVDEYYAKSPVNKWGIASRTNYMVWVSLSEYKVRLYQGSQYRWKLMLEAPCAIGAPGTPSITGSYEYLYKTRWDYGTYYVGPCLVFHGGYALHSVLLYQNGSEYDGRVGVKISHGCIRLKKKDIDFIAKTIPVGTRIYCTK